MFSGKLFVAAALAASGTFFCAAQQAAVIEPNGPARPANANAIYQALRGNLPMGDGVTVKDLTLVREGGTFHFAQGSFYFYGEVNGRVTGAVFEGQGHFELALTDTSEKRSLALLTKSGAMSQDFSTLVLRFTDGTAAEIRKASAGSAGAATRQSQQMAAEVAKDFRQKLHENLEVRLMEDVADPQAKGGMFLAAFRMGGVFTGRNVLFVVDPEGTAHARPDQVELSTWDADGVQVWAAYAMHEHGGAVTGLPIRISDQKLDVSFEKSGTLHGAAQATVEIERDGLSVVHMDLYPTLRVSGVYAESGQPLDFIQERKEDDPDFAIVLAQPAKKGDVLHVLTKYAGPDAVRRDGQDVYYLMEGARESWYPSAFDQFGNFARFHMTFHLPKGLQIVATGKQVSSDKDSGGTRVVWDSGDPIAVAGFNLGNFASGQMKTPQGFEIEAFANQNPPDNVQSLAEAASSQHSGMAMGNMSTVGALKPELSQGNAAIQIYSDYFGKLPYDHVALTQQSACNFGQSWPMLVYLPICAFWDSTIQNQLGLLSFGGASYWKEVTPHEVAHQWWGQLVGFKSYRDQWMSEGFANFSVGIYLHHTGAKQDEYRGFWDEQRKSLLEKNAMGKRPIDVGPLTMGVRVANDKTGNVYQALIYSKGAYVMHMLEMMYWTPQMGEAPFRKSMQAFVTEYAGKAATTEDLKASLEKTMPKWLDIRNDGRLDWFFNEYVYGTELPHYTLTSDVTAKPDGSQELHFKLTQGNVSDSFAMLVPLYVQLENGKVMELGKVSVFGSATVEKTVTLPKMASPVKKMELNYNSDVLSD